MHARPARAPLAVAAMAVLLAALPAGRAFPQDVAAELKSDDVRVRLAAVEKIAASPGPDAEALLLDALKDRDWEVIERAAAALGKSGGDAARKALVAVAVEGPVRRLRATAARSLVELGATEAASEVIAARAQGDRAIASYETLAAMSEVVTNDALAKAIDRGLKSAPDLNARPAAALGLAAFEPNQRAARLQQLAFDADIPVAAAALDSVRVRPDETLMAPLLAVLNAPKLPESVERRARRGVVAIVASRTPGEAAAAAAQRPLAALETAGSPEAAARLARLAGDLAEPPAALVPAALAEISLGKVAGHADANVRAAVAQALGRIGGDPAADRATDMAVNDKNARVRFLAVQAVAKARGALHAGAFKLFVDRLGNDADPLVREEAAVALGRKGVQGAVPALQKAAERAMAAKDQGEWAVGTCALVSLGKTEDPAAVPVLLDVLDRAKDWRLRASAVVGLGHVRKNEAVPRLIEALDAKEPPIRMSAYEFLRRLTAERVPGKRPAWTEWWAKNGPGHVFIDREEEAKKAQKAGYAPTPTGVYEGLDVVVLQSRGDHIEQMLEHLRVDHRLTRSGAVPDAGLHPLAVFVSNCTGEVTDKDVEPLQWFVRSGGHLFGSCWALSKTIERVVPGVVRKAPTKQEVLENVPSYVCREASPFVRGVIEPGAVPIYVLFGSHLIEVLDPDRAEVLIDSPVTEMKFGCGNMAAWFRAGHGVVLDSANHFDLQGFERVIGLKTGDDRKAYAIDHMGLSYAEAREIPDKTWDSGSKANKEVRDLSAFRFITNFVREKRKSQE